MKILSSKKIRELHAAGVKLSCRVCGVKKIPGAMRTETLCESCNRKQILAIKHARKGS